MVLTKEEKKAKKEAKKLELLKAEEEARKKAKRDELVREIAAHTQARKKLDDYWLQIMYKIKEPVFRKDIKVMRQTFERAYDKKDHTIDLIMYLRGIADDQYQRTICNFCTMVDNTIRKFLADSEIMKEKNDKMTANLLQQNETDIKSILRDSYNAERHVKLLLYNSDQLADNITWTTRGEDLAKKDDEAYRYSELREDLISILEDNYSVLWDNFKVTLKINLARVADNLKEMRKLRTKQNKMADIIAAQTKKISSNEIIIRHLRAELAAYESGTNQAAFRDRRARHRDACYRLKKRFYHSMNTDIKQLATLVKASDDAIEWLDAAYKKGEKSLRLADLCRKYETHREKVLPYGTTMPQIDSNTNIRIRQKSSDDSLAANAISTTNGLTRIWRQMSTAELSKRALYREKIILEQENADLMSKIVEHRAGKHGPDTLKCSCAPKTLEKSLRVSQPNAVEGSLEAKKIYRFY